MRRNLCRSSENGTRTTKMFDSENGCQTKKEHSGKGNIEYHMTHILPL